MKIFLKASLLLFTVANLAQANVSISSSSFQEVTKVTPSGEKIKEWAKTEKVVPGTVVRYVNTLENSGATTATKLLVKNPIPNNMEYVEGSASCQGTCSLSYSVDGGKSFKNPSELYVGVGESRHLAKASEYTDIRWVIEALGANSQSFVDYKAQLK